MAKLIHMVLRRENEHLPEGIGLLRAKACLKNAFSQKKKEKPSPKMPQNLLPKS